MAADLLSAAPGRDAAVRVWRSRRAGPALRAAGGLVLLWAALHVLLRHNQPPEGVYVYGGLIGLLYALLAFGLMLIYRANRFISFAQAEIGATTAVLGVLLIKVHHVPYLVALAVALVTGALAGAVVELVLRRFANAPRLVPTVATIAIALIFAALQLLMPTWIGGRFLVDPTPPKTPLSSLKFTIGQFHLDANAVIIGVWALGVLAGLQLFFRYTDVGLAVRASAENRERASLLGVPVKRVSTVVWLIAGALSALSVFLRVPVVGIPVGAFIGPEVLLYGLAAAVIAKMENFGTALAAGIGLGVIEQCVYYFTKDSTVSSALILPILLLAMLVQRGTLSRGQDSGVATWSLAKEYRPIPPELRDLTEVAWARFLLGAAGLALVLGGYQFLPFKQQILSSVIVIYGIVVVSLVILTGWAGQISLGQWGFAAVGAAITGNMAARHNADFFVTMGVAGVAGAAVSVIIGLPALRIRGLYLAVTTLAFAITMQAYFLSPTYFRSFLPTFSQRIPRPILYGHYSLNGDRAFFYMCLVVLALSMLSARALRKSRAGRVLIAVRDNQKGAQSYAVSASAAKLWAFALSGFWAAVAGSLFAYQLGSIPPQAFPPELSLTLVVVLVIGGVTSLPGAALAIVLYGAIQYGDLSQSLQLAGIGFVGLFLLLFFPGGLAQIFYSGRDSALRWLATRKEVVVPSLLADVRTDTAADDVLHAAAASVSASGSVDTNGDALEPALPGRGGR